MQAWDLSWAYRSAVSLNRILAGNSAGTALFSGDAFVIASPELAAIMKQIETVGTPLKEWDVAIYRGILTGFNEAFIIDGLVYELYFPAEIKAAGKELLPCLGELTPLSDGMTSEEKLVIIQCQFDRLYDPRHPVRNHLETLDSIEVVRTIREALKK